MMPRGSTLASACGLGRVGRRELKMAAAKSPLTLSVELASGRSGRMELKLQSFNLGPAVAVRSASIERSRQKWPRRRSATEIVACALVFMAHADARCMVSS
jgi:hypothetical protein